MQRFGTSTVPTHVTGLQLLKGQWAKAVESILSLREGEHPDCVVARLAWLEDGDYEKALQLMPRRSIAERCIWEWWSKGQPKEDCLGALSQVNWDLELLIDHR
jgi:tRNA pseudouridine13 synthase